MDLHGVNLRRRERPLRVFRSPWPKFTERSCDGTSSSGSPPSFPSRDESHTGPSCSPKLSPDQGLPKQARTKLRAELFFPYSLLVTPGPPSTLNHREFCGITSERLISQKPGFSNIWRSTILQSAASDVLIPDGILSVGGVHLAASTDNNPAIREATTAFVLRSIAGLQQALKKWSVNSSASTDDTLRLVVITFLLAQHDVS